MGMTTFVVSRKLVEHKNTDDPAVYEYWNGNDPWGKYAKANHYDKDTAMSIAASVAMHSEYVYLVEEIDEVGFVVCEYQV